MSRKRHGHRSLWSLTVLSLLRVRPMHPYEMQRLIREWHKDEFLDLKRGSLYHAIARLSDAGLIDAIETRREGKRPERTVYRLTDSGESELFTWLGELLAKPTGETMPFFAALSFLPLLAPDTVAQHLRQRQGLLEEEITRLNATLKQMVPRIGRLVLLEVEYSRAVRKAELAWVKTLIGDLHAGRLSWDPEAARRGAAAYSAAQETTDTQIKSP